MKYKNKSYEEIIIGRRKSRERRILEALSYSTRPRTIGNIFLLTGIDNATASRALQGLCEKGLVKEQLMTVYNKTYHGLEQQFTVKHWFLTLKGRAIFDAKEKA